MIRILVGFGLVTCLAFGQGTGRMTGSVVDTSGGAVPKAKVSVTLHEGKSALIETQTGSEGLFTVDSLRPVYYDVTVEATGFATAKLDNVKIDPSRSTDLPPIRLQVAAARDRKSTRLNSSH